MRISDIYENKKSIAISYEFFPPKTEKGWDDLFRTIERLVPLHPSFVSITYGAGGSSRERTHELVVRIQRETGIPVVAHLTCIGSNRQTIQEIVGDYVDKGIRNILALRGDIPAAMSREAAFPSDGFQYASDLVAFIKEQFPHISVGVAGFPEGHPEAANRLQEIEWLKAKVDAGADYIITQLFFDNRDFYDFRDRCDLEGIRVPIVPGIMPIVSTRNMQRMAELSAGTRFPAGMLRAMRRAQGDEYVRKVGVHWATEQVRDLVDNGVPGIHFYTLNRSRAAEEVCASLGLKHYLGLTT